MTTVLRRLVSGLVALSLLAAPAVAAPGLVAASYPGTCATNGAGHYQAVETWSGGSSRFNAVTVVLTFTGSAFVTCNPTSGQRLNEYFSAGLLSLQRYYGTVGGIVQVGVLRNTYAGATTFNFVYTPYDHAVTGHPEGAVATFGCALPIANDVYALEIINEQGGGPPTNHYWYVDVRDLTTPSECFATVAGTNTTWDMGQEYWIGGEVTDSQAVMGDIAAYGDYSGMTYRYWGSPTYHTPGLGNGVYCDPSDACLTYEGPGFPRQFHSQIISGYFENWTN